MFLRKNKNGFTLLELLVVMAIIGLILTAVMAAVGVAREKARNNSRLVQAQEYLKAMENYFYDNGTYPCADNRAADCDDLTQINFNNSWSRSAGRTLVNNGYLPEVSDDPLFGTNTAGSQCNGVDSTGYCYCQSSDYPESLVLTVELEGQDRCMIMRGPNASALCLGHTGWGTGSQRPLCVE